MKHVIYVGAIAVRFITNTPRASPFRSKRLNRLVVYGKGAVRHRGPRFQPGDCAVL